MPRQARPTCPPLGGEVRFAPIAIQGGAKSSKPWRHSPSSQAEHSQRADGLFLAFPHDEDAEELDEGLRRSLFFRFFPAELLRRSIAHAPFTQDAAAVRNSGGAAFAADSGDHITSAT